MDRIDWSSAPESAIYERLADTTSRPPPPPPLPFLSTWPEFPTQPQPVQSGDYDEFLSQGTAPYTMAAPTTYDEPTCEQDSTYAGSSYSQADAYNQGQYNDGVMIHPEVSAKSLPHVGVLNGERVFKPLPAVPPASSAAPPQSSYGTEKQKKRRQKEEKEAYVTKPPNAFMLFMKEQRPNVGPQVRCKGSAAVNAFLGQKWKSLSEQAQAKYYDEAERLRLLHKQQHPEWSNRENYGKRMTTRDRRKVARRAEATADYGQQAKRMCATLEATAPTLAPPTQPSLMESHHPQATVEQLLHAPPPPLCNMYNLPQVSDGNSGSLLGSYNSWMEMLTSPDMTQFNQPVGFL